MAGGSDTEGDVFSPAVETVEGTLSEVAQVASGDIEPVPGRAYDHSDTSAGACFEWADGETSSSKL